MSPCASSVIRSLRLIAIAAATALLAIACSGESVGSDELPSWLEEVTPRPDATYAPNQGVSVRFELPTDPDIVTQLWVDGVDVTAAALDGTGLLRYDESSELVRLDEGRHRAMVQRVVIGAFGVDDVVIDSYSWEFRVG